MTVAIDWTALGTSIAGVSIGVWGAIEKFRAARSKRGNARAGLDDLAKRVTHLSSNVESLSSAVQSGNNINRSSIGTIREEFGKLAHEVANLTAAVQSYIQIAMTKTKEDGK